MIVVAAMAVLLVAMRSSLALGVVFLALCLTFAAALGWMLHGFRRLSGLSFGVVGTLTNILCLAICVVAYGFGGIALIGIGSFVTFPIVIGSGAAWAIAATRRTARPRYSPFWVWPLVLTAALLPLSMLITSWPFRLAFLVSRPALENVADRVAAGQAVTGPEWAGLFRVVGSAVDSASGNVGLITDQDPAGRSGFVRGRTGGPFFNLNIYLPLCDEWTYQCED
jgi:hypothetical protein